MVSLGEGERTKIRARQMGFVFQDFNLVPTLTAIENVLLACDYAGIKGPDAKAAAAEALGLVGLAERADHRPAELSGGEQQRVAIARALVNKPSLILADEPTGNLDTKTSREIMDLVTSLNRDQGITVVMVTHETDIAAYAKRVIRFVDGRIDSDVQNREAA
jgi:putative ABC transport system ATP-binding protein